MWRQHELMKCSQAPASMSSASLLAAVAFFALQIYCDFAGYSDIARGCGRLLGIELMENFNHPYFATNITEFWRRWHISLSTWLRDYLYIPLGGSRGPRWLSYRNLMITMPSWADSGTVQRGRMWYGVVCMVSRWYFIRLGCVEHAFLNVPTRVILPTFSRAFAGWVATMGVVAAAWVFFRAPDCRTALEFLGGICAAHGGFRGASLRLLSELIIITLAIDLPQYLTRDHTVFLRWPWLVRGCLYATIVLSLAFSGGSENVPFIYFQF